MGAEWREVKLGELGEVNRGRSRHRPRNAPELYGGPYPFVQTGDIKASHGRITSHKQTYNEIGLAQSRLWPAETMVITIAANIAETSILTYPACFPDSVVGFVADKSVCDVRFVEYMFRVLRSNIQHENVGTGSVQDNINLKTLDELRFRIPPLTEQCDIAYVLGTLDDKIELNRQMNETLEELARALFKSWFVDFDPVHAKMEGRDTGLPPDISDLFPDRLVDSELGKIPEGWKVFCLDELVDHHRLTITPSIYPEMKFEHFSIPAYDDGQTPVIERGETIKSIKTIIPPDAVLLSKLNPEIPRVWMPDVSCDDPQICSTEFLVFTPRSFANRSLLFSLFTNTFFREILQSMVTGTSKSHQRVPPKALKQCEVLSGTPDMFGKFQDLMSSMLDLTVRNRADTQSLASLLDTLLPKLISGEVSVKHAGPVIKRML